MAWQSQFHGGAGLVHAIFTGDRRQSERKTGRAALCRSVDHFGGSAKSLHRCRQTAVDARMQQHLLNLLRRRAVVERTAHMARELMLLAQGREEGHRDQAARLHVESRALPHIAPGIAGNEFLNRLGEGRGIAKGIGHEVLAHDLLARGQAFVEVFGGWGLGHAGSPLQLEKKGCHVSRPARLKSRTPPARPMAGQTGGVIKTLRR